jgi:hypothetical protein
MYRFRFLTVYRVNRLLTVYNLGAINHIVDSPPVWQVSLTAQLEPDGGKTIPALLGIDLRSRPLPTYVVLLGWY